MSIFFIQLFYVSMMNVTPYNLNSGIVSKATTTPPKTSKLNIFYYNDTHGNSDQMSGLVHHAKNFKKFASGDSVNFVLSGGDNYSGGDCAKNHYILNLMQNMMGVDVSAVGNHELDGSCKGLFETMKDKKIPFVATNVEFENNNPAKDIVKKSLIKEQNGVKYGFVGAMPMDFETCTKKENQEDIDVMDFEDTIEEIQEEVDNLKKQGVNKIILLSHNGYEEDKKLARALDGVDIIIGGHSHSVVEGAKQGENLVMSKSNQPVIITQAGENGKYYGVLNVEFNENGVLTKIQNNLNLTDSNKKSPTLEYIKNTDLGKSPQVAVINEIEPMAKNRRTAPSAWANLMADSMRQELGTDIALINSANIRKVPQAGTLTERDIQESAPMKNRLIKTTITQKQVTEAISSAAKRTMSSPDGSPGLLQVSGMTYKIDDRGNLLELNFIDKKGNSQPIDINNPSDKIKYSVTYDSFVAQKDGEYPELALQFPHQEFDFDKDTTAINYISKLQSKTGLNIIDDKRLQIQKTSKVKLQDNSMQSFLRLTCPKVS